MTFVSDLLAGPRGRDFLMNVALALDGGQGPLFQATWRVGDYMGRNTRKFKIPRKRSAEARARTAASLLEQVPLAGLTPRLLYDALEYTVFSATYWQEPTNNEVFLSAKSLRPGLRRIAGHVAASDMTSGWSDLFQPDRHHCVRWEQPDSEDSLLSMAETLETWREEAQTREFWWSTSPRLPVIATARELPDGTPGVLRFVEDGAGWMTGEVYATTVSTGAQAFTISGPDAWAQLCRKFPLDVTASKGRDWRLATGYPHDWVMPDFVQVAQHYDALHLSMRGYFATAGRLIPVGNRHASMLAGWDPGQTFWFTDAVKLDETPVKWRNYGDSDSSGGQDWRQETGS